MCIEKEAVDKMIAHFVTAPLYAVFGLIPFVSHCRVKPLARHFLPADKVIIAVGQKPARRIIGSTKGIQVDENGFVKVKERPYGMTTRHGIFSGGDVVHGPATVVRAMKNAKKVSLGIEQYVEAKKLMEECGLQMPKA